MKTFNTKIRLFFLTISFGFLFAENKSDSFNFVLNGSAVKGADNGKAHPVEELKQKLDGEKSEKDDSLSSKIETERREKTKKEEAESMSKRIKEDLKKNRK